MDPLTLSLILSMVSSGTQAVGGAMGQNKQREADEALTREKLALDREQGLMGTALNESLADPFRHQTAQAGAMTGLDRLEHASYTPFSMDLPAPYAQYKPKMSGGYSWQPSAEVRAGAGKLKQSVMAGRTAPSMTSPDNFGKTAALDLTGVADATTDAAFASGAPNRDTLGAPSSAGAFRPPITTRKGSESWRAQQNADRRAQDVAAFEQQNPGWTIDELGRVARKARV